MNKVVGIGDMKVSADTADTLVTYALGSCIGVAAYDASAKVGGLLHIMLPAATASPDRAKTNPNVYADTGLQQLLKGLAASGARKNRLLVKVAGGAAMQAEGSEDFFQIGKRNYAAIKNLLWKEGIMLRHADVGGNQSRTMSLDVSTGEVLLKTAGATKAL